MPTGHKDSVHCASFSHDSLLVATGDMKGVIKIWNAKSKTEVFSYMLPVEDAEDGDEDEKEDLMASAFCWLYVVRNQVVPMRVGVLLIVCNCTHARACKLNKQYGCFISI